MARPEVTGRKLHSRSPADPTATEIDDFYFSAAQVRQRYGDAGVMWLHRRLHDDSGFPQPDLVVCDRRFWKLSSLVRWERQHAANKPAAQTIPTADVDPKCNLAAVANPPLDCRPDPVPKSKQGYVERAS